MYYAPKSTNIGRRLKIAKWQRQSPGSSTDGSNGNRSSICNLRTGIVAAVIVVVAAVPVAAAAAADVVDTSIISTDKMRNTMHVRVLARMNLCIAYPTSKYEAAG